jgi:hypothetical protein
MRTQQSPIVRYEVQDAQGRRVALCNSRRLAENYASDDASYVIVEKIGVDKPAQ